MTTTANKLETLDNDGTLDVFHGVYRLNKGPDAPEFDRFGEWTGRGREPTSAECLAASDCADEVLVAFYQEQEAVDAARGWEQVDGGPRREDEWAEWDSLSDDDRLHFSTF